jgi:hypothetical protein
MIIVNWNCYQGNFREKYLKLLEHLNDKWDILIIQECEKPEHIRNKSETYYKWAKDHHCIWKGDNYNRGIGFFSNSRENNLRILSKEAGWENRFPNGEKYDYNEILEPQHLISEELKYIYPISINDDFVLIGVSTKKICGKGSTKYLYTGLISEYLKLNKEIIVSSDVIVIGDFNNNINLCSGDPKSTRDNDTKRFKKMLDEFEGKNIVSLYHYKNNIKNGDEKDPTRYHRCDKICENKNKCKYNKDCEYYFSQNRSYHRSDHIDYCFVSKRFQSGNIKIAEKNEWKIVINEKNKENNRWKGISDHCPMVIEL